MAIQLGGMIASDPREAMTYTALIFTSAITEMAAKKVVKNSFQFFRPAEEENQSQQTSKIPKKKMV